MGVLSNLFNRNKPTEVSPYYDRTALDETGAVYRIAIGGRSIGKTYSVCKTIVEDYFNKGHRAAYIRRYEEELKNGISAILMMTVRLLRKTQLLSVLAPP